MMRQLNVYVCLLTPTVLALTALYGPAQAVDGPAHWSQPTGGGSCWAARMCCEGRNLSCHVVSTGALRGDKEVGAEDGKFGHETDAKRSMCFCDSACLVLNDCCHDYKLACQPQDCVVSEEWGPWSDCDARCGLGMSTRTRSILQKPLNGGAPCPSTIQRVACEGTACKVARAGENQDELRETGKILPIKFGDWRNDVKYNPFKDIRRNIFERYHRKTMKVDRPTYCMKFELTDVWPVCHASAPSADNATSSALTKGNTLCVECQGEAMRKSLGSRCKGQGVLGKETRWKAVLTPGCHGKWVLKSRQEECTCQTTGNEEYSSFILL